MNLGTMQGPPGSYQKIPVKDYQPLRIAQESTGHLPNSKMVEFADSKVNGKGEEVLEDVIESADSNASDPEALNGAKKSRVEVEGPSKKRKRRSKSERSTKGAPHKKRRHSVSKPARDPRDEASPVASEPDNTEARSPSPVIDFDGLSKPSLCCAPDQSQFLTLSGRGTRERKEETCEQAAARLQKISGAVRTILECLGEDPEREGLLGTPERYAKAMLFFTKGYQENVRDIVNNAIFHEGHNELVIVKDIEVFSLCEHHMVPFTGKVGSVVFKVVFRLIPIDAYWIYSGQRRDWHFKAPSDCGHVFPPTANSRASYQRRSSRCHGDPQTTGSGSCHGI